MYRATRASDGAELAIKIQRPGLERKVALDFHVLCRILALAQERFGLAGDIPTIQSVLDEVGGGIFAELDLRRRRATSAASMRCTPNGWPSSASSCKVDPALPAARARHRVD